MTNFHLRAALTAALTGVVLSASTPVGSAGIDAKGSMASKDVSQAAPATIERSTTEREAPVTLYVEGPNGNAFRLIHVDGTGWQYAAGWQTDNGRFGSLLRKVTFRSARPAVVNAAPAADPLTVFIDGPSGYTFVWTREGAWKFVGKVSGRRS